MSTSSLLQSPWATAGNALDEWKHLFQQVDGDFNRNDFALFDVGVDELPKLWAGAAALLSQQVSGRQVSVAVVLSTGERRVNKTHYRLQCIIVNATCQIIRFLLGVCDIERKLYLNIYFFDNDN